jgi:Zn finger protein HypA/HybF involved in hydrogenase expression
VCFDCFKGIKQLKKPTMICPFCRGDIENVQAGNHQSLVNLVALK